MDLNSKINKTLNGGNLTLRSLKTNYFITELQELRQLLIISIKHLLPHKNVEARVF